MRPRRRPPQKCTTPNPKPLRLRRPHQKVDPMTELDPVTAQGHIAEPMAAPAPRKSRAGIFFFGAFSGCLIVVAGVLLFGVFIASIANNDSTTRGEVFGD